MRPSGNCRAIRGFDFFLDEISKYPNIKLLNITAGGNGSFSYYKGMKVREAGIHVEDVIETTGAGDTEHFVQ